MTLIERTDLHTDEQPPEGHLTFMGLQYPADECLRRGHAWEDRWQRSGGEWWRDCTRAGCEVAQIALTC